VITDARRVSEVLVGLPEVIVLSVDDVAGQPLVVHVEQAGARPQCIGCGAVPVVKDREVVELIDLPYAGRQSRLHWRMIRWTCRDSECPMTSWTWGDPPYRRRHQTLDHRLVNRTATLGVLAHEQCAQPALPVGGHELVRPALAQRLTPPLGSVNIQTAMQPTPVRLIFPDHTTPTCAVHDSGLFRHSDSRVIGRGRCLRPWLDLYGITTMACPLRFASSAATPRKAPVEN
jgi:hypothetical protein